MRRETGKGSKLKGTSKRHDLLSISYAPYDGGDLPQLGIAPISGSSSSAGLFSTVVVVVVVVLVVVVACLVFSFHQAVSSNDERRGKGMRKTSKG